jgi:hypothetical protein
MKKDTKEYKLTKNIKSYSPPPHEKETYDKIMGKKKETEEQTMASSSGSYEAPVFGRKILKKDIDKVHNFDLKETILGTGEFDVPFLGSSPKGRKDPLKIGGPKTIAKTRAVKDKNFPKWGGPGGVYIKVKEKCKKFPYCNQGDINAIEVLKEAITETAKNYGIPRHEVENIVLNEINKIFINYED